MNDFPTINGTIRSSAECTLTMAMYGGGKPVRAADIVDFSFGEKLEPSDVVVLGGRKLGTTEGIYSGTGSITLLVDGHNLLKEAMAKIARQRRIVLGAVMFAVQGSYRSTPSSPLVRFVASGCRMTELELEGANNADATQITSPLNIMGLTINGLSLGKVPR